MKFVVVLAALSCCYAADPTTPATQQKSHLPPQHIKDFVEQHIKYIKQQIPTIQQQIKEGKLKVEIQKYPTNEHKISENKKKFIKDHITQVLKYVYEQKEKHRSHIPLGTTTTNSPVPAIGIQKIEKLKEDIKDIMKQAETYIKQDINQQIANKKQK